MDAIWLIVTVRSMFKALSHTSSWPALRTQPWSHHLSLSLCVCVSVQCTCLVTFIHSCHWAVVPHTQTSTSTHTYCAHTLNCCGLLKAPMHTQNCICHLNAINSLKSGHENHCTKVIWMTFSGSYNFYNRAEVSCYCGHTIIDGKCCFKYHASGLFIKMKQPNKYLWVCIWHWSFGSFGPIFMLNPAWQSFWWIFINVPCLRRHLRWSEALWEFCLLMFV